LICLKDI